MEIYAATRPQDGRNENEDAFVIGRGETPYAALCDGSGNAQKAARRALGLFEHLLADAIPDDIARFQTWSDWTRLLDSSLIGNAQSTFLAIAFVGNRLVGTCAGDSRLYRVSADGGITILTEDAVKLRLGSGRVDPFPIHLRAGVDDIFLLMTDGAWTPLSMPSIKRLVFTARFRHLSELPSALLGEAGKRGRADDMTVIVARESGAPTSSR